jgi:dTDP-4-dehydrorhamnose reductase
VGVKKAKPRAKKQRNVLNAFLRRIAAAVANFHGRQIRNFAKPISTSEYPTPATRPTYSVLDCEKTETEFGVQQSDWRDELRLVLQQCSRDTRM